MEKIMQLKQVNSKHFLFNCLGIVVFAALSLFFAQKLYFFKSKGSEGFAQYDKLYNSTTLGYVESVEHIHNIGKKITYSYQVSNYWYKNTQMVSQDVSIAAQDKIQVSFDGFDSFDSCIAAKLLTVQSIGSWLLIFSSFLCAMILFFHFAIKIYDLRLFLE